MKFIFDFDDVLLDTAKRRTLHMYPRLEKAGVSLAAINEYYEKYRERKLFSMKQLIAHFSLPEEVYEELMKEIEDFRNDELVEIIKKLGKENCFIVSQGDEEFQLDKIKRTGVVPLFSEIVIVQETKKKAVEGICELYIDEEVVFIDDKIQNFEDLDLKKYPNLKTILYDEKGLEKIKKLVS